MPGLHAKKYHRRSWIYERKTSCRASFANNDWIIEPWKVTATRLVRASHTKRIEFLRLKRVEEKALIYQKMKHFRSRDQLRDGIGPRQEISRKPRVGSHSQSSRHHSSDFFQAFCHVTIMSFETKQSMFFVQRFAHEEFEMLSTMDDDLSIYTKSSLRIIMGLSGFSYAYRSFSSLCLFFSVDRSRSWSYRSTASPPCCRPINNAISK